MNTSLRLRAERRPFVAAAGLVLAAWAALALWSASPYAEWLDHSRMDAIPAPAAVRLAVFTLGWGLMIAAMMLPGTLVLLARCPRGEGDSLRQLAPLVAAYAAPWLAFGVFGYVGDSALHELVEHTPTLAGAIAPSVLLLAALYQFTPLKRACLARCGTLGMRFGSPAGGRGRWRLGLQHGLACLGSCWALMLVMFAFGGVNLLWMLALGIVMTAERLVRPALPLPPLLGGLLLLAAALVGQG